MNTNGTLLYKLTLEELRQQAARVLEMDRKNIATEAEIVELGFGLDSLARFVKGLSDAYEIEIHPGVFFEYTTLAAFCGYLLQEHQEAIREKLNVAKTKMVENPQKGSEPSPSTNETLSADELHAKLAQDVIQQAARALSRDERHVSLDVEISALGFNSVSLTAFAVGLSETYGMTLHPGIFFEYTTLNALIRHLLEKHGDSIRAYYGVSPKEAATVSEADAFATDEPIPVIIGAGITGMCISRALSQHRIKHVMVGDLMVNDTPKLGESMNESASIDLLQEYSEFSEYFFVKKEINFYSRDTVAFLNLRGKKGHTFYDAYERLGFNPKTEYAHMVHIERLGFDRALYGQVSSSPYCTVIPKHKVTALDYDEQTDVIRKIDLENGEKLFPSFVFDATNHVRLLGKLLKIDAEIFDKPRHVFFTHYGHFGNGNGSGSTCSTGACGDEAWRHATNIVRAHKDIDGIEGVCWCIPEGAYISVGISVDSKDAVNYTKEEAVDLLNQAYRRRGIDYVRSFPERREIVEIPGTRHFIHNKIHGKNWLMAGGTACQIWFPSGSNISISLLAAKIAPKVLQSDPVEWLQIYQQINSNLAKLHGSYDRWVRDDCRSLAELGLFAKDIYSFGNRRMALYALVRNGKEYADVAKKMSTSEIPKYAMMSQEVRVIKEADLPQQTRKLDEARSSLFAYFDTLAEEPEVNTEEEPVIEVL